TRADAHGAGAIRRACLARTLTGLRYEPPTHLTAILAGRILPRFILGSAGHIDPITTSDQRGEPWKIWSSALLCCAPGGGSPTCATSDRARASSSGRAKPSSR